MHRINRPWANDTSLCRTGSNGDHSSDSESSTQLPIRACFDDLKRPENRQKLRRQLTGTFPETAQKMTPRRPSNEVLIEKWSLKDKLSKKTLRLEMAEVEAQSSSSTVNSVGLKRLSAVPEKDGLDQGIDIEQAINLLQELKKFASPTDLVALHRALLPTKETERVKSPLPSPLEERSPARPLSRARSILPPGLATRGGANEDVLRKPNGARNLPPTSRPVVKDDWCTHRPAASQNSLAALDLADDSANPVTTRPVTPSESAYGHTGVYRPGTLRVTNGAASPVPSIRHTPAVEAVREDLRADFKPALQSRATIDVMSAKTSKDSRAVRNRIADLEKTGQYEMHVGSDVAEIIAPTTKPKAHRLAQVTCASGAEKSTPNESEPCALPSPKPNDSSFPPHKPAGEAGNDRPDVARLSMLNLASCLLPADDVDGHDPADTPRDVAYARLNGATSKEGPASSSARSSQERAWSSQYLHSRKVHKIDSGYSSDISLQAVQPHTIPSSSPVQALTAVSASPDHDATRQILPKRQESLPRANGYRAVTASKSPVANDVTKVPGLHAQHTKEASLSDGTNTSVRNSIEDVDTALPTMPPAATTSSTFLSRGESKFHKKLKKSMPPAEKYRRKLEAERKKQEKLAEQFSQPAPKFDTPLSAEDLQKAAELLGYDEPSTPLASEQQAETSLQHTKSQGQNKKRGSRDMTATNELPQPETSWRSKLRSKSSGRSKSQPRPRDDHESEEDNLKTARNSASLPSRDEVRVLIGSSIHTDFYPVPPPTEPARVFNSRVDDRHTLALTTAPSQRQGRSPSRSRPDRIKAKSMGGMSEAAATEFARARSRDLSRDRLPLEDRPRTVTPTRSSPKTSSPSAQDVRHAWPSKTGLAPSHAANRRSLYAESIPPLPDLPADVEVKAHRADEAMAKKLKHGSRHSALLASRTSPAVSARNSAAEREMTWPEAAKAAVQEIAPVSPMERSSAMFATASVPASPMSQNLNREAEDEVAAAHLVERVTPDPVDSDLPMASGWESQAKLWRQRRLSIGATLGKPVAEDDGKPAIIRQASVTSIRKAHSPSIVITRYVTPLSKDNGSKQNIGRDVRDSASIHADSYIELIGKENQPSKDNLSRATSAVSSTESFVSALDRPQSKSAPPRKSYEIASAPLTKTSSGRVRTESGSWRPYSPQHASYAERSRALSLAKLTGEAPHDDDIGNASPVPTSPYGRQQQQQQQRHPDSPSKSTESLLDRYSGGLGYNWERTSGFNGSAGTRVSGSEMGHNHRSVPMSQAFGLDLSDVPVILRKVL